MSVNGEQKIPAQGHQARSLPHVPCVHGIGPGSALVAGDNNVIRMMAVGCIVICPSNRDQPSILHLAYARFEWCEIALWTAEKFRAVIPGPALVQAPQEDADLSGWIRSIGHLIRRGYGNQISGAQLHARPGDLEQFRATTGNNLGYAPGPAGILRESDDVVSRKDAAGFRNAN